MFYHVSLKHAPIILFILILFVLIIELIFYFKYKKIMKTIPLMNHHRYYSNIQWLMTIRKDT